MTTLTLNADEKSIVYTALRAALEKADDIVADDEAFPGETDADTVATAVKEAAQIQELLDKLA